MAPLLIQFTNLMTQALLLAVVGWSVWSNYCIARTLEDRMQAAHSRLMRPMSFAALKAACDAVPFRMHLRARFWGHDPWKLYDPIVLDAIKNPVIEMMMPGEPPDAPTFVH